MFQVTEVLQVQLPGVLRQVDRVHILLETQRSRVNRPRWWRGARETQRQTRTRADSYVI